MLGILTLLLQSLVSVVRAIEGIKKIMPLHLQNTPPSLCRHFDLYGMSIPNALYS